MKGYVWKHVKWYVQKHVILCESGAADCVMHNTSVSDSDICEI